jgi:hypothetical protein
MDILERMERTLLLPLSYLLGHDDFQFIKYFGDLRMYEET